MSLHDTTSTSYVKWKPDKNVLKFFDNLKRERDLQTRTGASQNKNTVKIAGVMNHKQSVDPLLSTEQHMNKDIPIGLKSSAGKPNISSIKSAQNKRSPRQRKKVVLERNIAEAWL